MFTSTTSQLSKEDQTETLLKTKKKNQQQTRRFFSIRQKLVKTHVVNFLLCHLQSKKKTKKKAEQFLFDLEEDNT
jgi:hypothetical protein